MRILLTNDDGITAPGLQVLEAIARAISDDIWIVAPHDEQSGAGHSLTLTRPLRIHRHGDRRFSVSGTPTDSVMMAIGHLMKDCPPDLILSGVNRGANLAEHVTYSGTVSAAMEGAISGIRSIALSQVYSKEGMGDAVPFDAAQVWGERVVRALLDAPVGERLVNVNFPPIPADQVKGVRVARQGFHDPGLTHIVEGRDPRGYSYYWFGLGTSGGGTADGTDIAAIRDGYISVTPLHYDLTHDASLATLKDALEG